MKTYSDSFTKGRRKFLRTLTLTAGALALGSCSTKSKEDSVSNEPEGEPGHMTLRTTPTTGDKVSLLGFGCMRLPQVDGKDSEIDRDALNDLVDCAMKAGVNYYDTSPVYCKGNSEKAMGETLSRYPRDSYFIATKLSNFSPDNYPFEKSVEMFNRSLEYLKTDYIDYYLLHAVGSGGADNMHKRYIDNGILPWLLEQRKAGKIRNLGFSFHGDINAWNELLAMHDNGTAKWDFVQIQLNYVNWEHAAEGNGITAKKLLEDLQKRNIPAVIMEPLLGGSLADVPDAVHTKMMERDQNASPASWAFRFCAQPGVLTVLSGMKYIEHIKDNCATYSPLTPLSADETEFLLRCARTIVENDTIPCTGCCYCMPCPYGVDIPGCFSHFNMCINDDNMPHSSGDPNYRQARRAYLVEYDRNVERLRQADHCIDCKACVRACPQSIDIPAQLARINNYTEKLKQNKI